MSAPRWPDAGSTAGPDGPALAGPVKGLAHEQMPAQSGSGNVQHSVSYGLDFGDGELVAYAPDGSRER